jgi:hypothetical protein
MPSISKLRQAYFCFGGAGNGARMSTIRILDGEVGLQACPQPPTVGEKTRKRPWNDLLCARMVKHDLSDDGDIGWQERQGNLQALAGPWDFAGFPPSVWLRRRIKKSPAIRDCTVIKRCAGSTSLHFSTTETKQPHGQHTREKRNYKLSNMGISTRQFSQPAVEVGDSWVKEVRRSAPQRLVLVGVCSVSATLRCP